MAVITNTTVTTDVAPAISIDVVSRLSASIRALQELLNITDPIPMAEGSTVNVLGASVGTIGTQAAEGDEVGLTKVTLTSTPITMALKPYRKLVTAQAIQKVGRERAIYDSDRALIGAVRKDIKDSFYTALTGAGGGTTPAASTLQAQLANAWATLHNAFEEYDIEPVHFINPTTVAAYLGSASITTQSAFGFDYVEDFLGLGTVIFAPSITANKVVSTAKENLRCAYVPANGAVGQEFEMTSDETGLVGITHGRALDRFSIETLLMSGVKFFAEDMSKVFTGTISA